MSKGGEGSAEATATLLPVHDPPRRSKPNSSFAGLLDLPDEILSGILEFFVSPALTGPLVRTTHISYPYDGSHRLFPLLLVNKRTRVAALPLFWRHLSSHHKRYCEMYQIILEDAIENKSPSTQPSPLSRLPTHLVTSLTFSWLLSTSDPENFVIPEIIGVCKNLRYLDLDFIYMHISKDEYDSRCSCRDEIRWLAGMLHQLEALLHLGLRFRECMESYDTHCPVEDYVSTLTRVKSNSLQSLVLSGLSGMVRDPELDRYERSISFEEAFNYPALAMIDFPDDISGRYISHVLDRLSVVAQLQTLSFGHASTSTLSSVPLAMRPSIKSLDLEGSDHIDASVLLSFPSLQYLQCKVDDISHPRFLSHQELRDLTLCDNIHNIVAWFQDYVPHADYIPKLRFVRAIVMWTCTIDEDRKTMMITVPEGRDIRLKVEYKQRYDRY